jgi:hypothetical protein
MVPAADIFKKSRRVVPDSVGRLLFVMGMFPSASVFSVLHNTRRAASVPRLVAKQRKNSIK